MHAPDSTPPARPNRRASRWICGAAFAWGLAEATLFFLVPDVLLSAVALRRLRLALAACVATVIGACLGGALIYALTLQDAAASQAFLLRIPGINPHWLQRASELTQTWGPAGMILGAWVGVPYKLFAWESAQLSLGWPAFLLLSVVARALRFLVVVGLTHVLARLLQRRLGWRWIIGIWSLVWLVSYGLYWTS